MLVPHDNNDNDNNDDDKDNKDDKDDKDDLVRFANDVSLTLSQLRRCVGGPTKNTAVAAAAAAANAIS